jgi:hypothetical protein
MRFNRGAIVGCEDLANVFKQDAFGSRPCAGAGRPISFHSVIVGNFGDRRPLLFLADNPVKHTIAGPRLPATRHLSSVHVVL